MMSGVVDVTLLSTLFSWEERTVVESFILLADIFFYKTCQAGVIQSLKTLYSCVQPLVQHLEVPSTLSKVKT